MSARQQYHVRLFDLTPTLECELDLEGRVFAVATPYSREFVDAIKADVRPHHRGWSPQLKLWFVDGSRRIVLREVLNQTFGADAFCPACAAGDECAFWRSVESRLRAQGFREVMVDEDARERARQQEAETAAEALRRERERQRAEDRARRAEQEREQYERAARERAQQQSPEAQGPKLPATRLEAAIVLGLPVGQLDDHAATKRAFAAAALRAHPDQGGSDAAMRAVLRARELLMAYFAGRVDQSRAQQQYAGARR